MTHGKSSSQTAAPVCVRILCGPTSRYLLDVGRESEQPLSRENGHRALEERISLGADFVHNIVEALMRLGPVVAAIEPHMARDDGLAGLNAALYSHLEELVSMVESQQRALEQPIAVEADGELHLRIRALQDQARSKDRALAELTQQLLQEKDRVAEDRARGGIDATTNAAALKDEISRLQVANEELQRTKETEVRDWEEARSQLREMDRAIERAGALEAELTLLKRQSVEWKGEGEQQRAEEALAAMERERDAAKTEADQLRETLSAAEALREGLSADLVASEGSIGQLRAELAVLRAERDTLWDEAEASTAAWEAKMSDHAREIENARAEAKRLSEEHAVQLAFHDAREESAQRAHAEGETRLHEALAVAVQLREEWSHDATALEEARAALLELQSQLALEQAAAEQVARESSRLSAEAESACAQSAALREDLEFAEAALVEREKAVTEERARAERAEAEAVVARQALEQEREAGAELERELAQVKAAAERRECQLKDPSAPNASAERAVQAEAVQSQAAETAAALEQAARWEAQAGRQERLAAAWEARVGAMSAEVSSVYNLNPRTM